MTHKSILTVSIICLLAIGILALLVYQASPGPSSQDILGVTLGRPDNESTGIAFLSGRRLDCAPDNDPPYTSICTVTIDGQLLTIQAFRNGPEHPNQLGGGCEATYAGEVWPCQMVSRHVHVHWFAHISEPLGLNGSQMDVLRRQYFFENLPEEPFLYSILALPFILTMLVVAGFFAWRYPPQKRTWLTAVALGLFTFIGTFLLTFTLTNNFWD